MIKVFKNFDQPPDFLTSKNCKKTVQKLLVQKNEHNFSSYYYGNPEKVRKKLEEIYHYKCAYCETNIKAGATLQVEHYRPKAKVEEDKKHTGYYWLAYEWTNLLLACPKCNGAGAKANHFPIEGKRIYSPLKDDTEKIDFNKFDIRTKEWQNENPLLLNPEIDKPEEHLSYLPDGQIQGITPKGKATIDICKLNRPELIEARYRIVYQFFMQIKLVLLDFPPGIDFDKKQFKKALKRRFETLKNNTNSASIYAALHRYMINYFDLFANTQLKDKHKDIIKIAFRYFTENKL